MQMKFILALSCIRREGGRERERRKTNNGREMEKK
jgi:hypothetical protein